MCNGRNFQNKLLQYYQLSNIFVTTLNSNTPTAADFMQVILVLALKFSRQLCTKAGNQTHLTCDYHTWTSCDARLNRLSSKELNHVTKATG